MKNITRANIFYRKCHEGFGIAQRQIIPELIVLEEKVPTLKQAYQVEITAFKKRGSKFPLPQYSQAGLDYKKCVGEIAMLKEVANSIAWQLVKGDGTVLRAMVQGERGGFLKDKNIQSSIEFAEHINKNKNGFALITDITSCVEVGDALMRNPDTGQLGIVELKEGKINEVIQDIFRMPPQCEIAKIKFKEYSEKHGKPFVNQFRRVIKQKQRMTNVAEYINNYEGVDIQSGANRFMNAKPVEIENYLEELRKWFKDLKKTGNEIVTIDGCLTVGIFDNKKLKRSHVATEMDFKHHVWHIYNQKWENCEYGTENHGRHFIDYMQLEIIGLYQKIFSPSHAPLFVNYLPREIVFDLLFRRKTLYYFFSQSGFVELCKSKGIEATLITGKEYRRVKAKHEKENIELLDLQNSFIKLENKPYKFELSVGGGMLCRILFEWQRPSAVADQFKEDLKRIPLEMIEREKKKKEKDIKS